MNEINTAPARAYNRVNILMSFAERAKKCKFQSNILLGKMIPDAFPLRVREPNHSTFISDRQQSAILR